MNFIAIKTMSLQSLKLHNVGLESAKAQGFYHR